MRRVSLIFPAYNRLEFTQQSWAALIANTDWSLVSEFHVYNDGSTDGTREFLSHWNPAPDCRSYFHNTEFRSPMGVTLDWIKRSSAPILAKLDNDAIYPPGWLKIALDVMDRHPKLDMLGLECMRSWNAPESGRWAIAPNDVPRGFLPAQFVSGLGLYRKSVFDRGLPADGGYFGLEEWQTEHRVSAGWILPSLPVFLLDRLPMEPWKSLSEEYVRRGWQREWSGAGALRYKPEQSAMWDWWQPVK